MIPVEFQERPSGTSVPSKLPRVMVWFRRDLRIDDNLALNAALEVAEEVVSFCHGSRLENVCLISSLELNPCLHPFPLLFQLVGTCLHLCSRGRRPIPTWTLLPLVA